MRYKVMVKTKTRNLFDSVGKLEDSLNETMKDFHYNDKVYLETEMQFFEITTKRELTAGEQVDIINMIDDELTEEFGDKYKVSGLELDG